MLVEERRSYLNEAYDAYKINPAFDKLRPKATQFVPGDGRIDAPVMMVGEAPGPHEDRAGRPFVGPSGQILDKLLKAALLNRNDCFITNTVKYRTVNDNGNNRHPTPQEVLDSLDCLKQEIVYVNPKVLALMGRTPIQAFFPEYSPGKDHGMIFRLTPTSRPIVMLYHPGIVLYSTNGESMMETLVEDYKQVTQALREQSGGDDS